MAHRGFNPKVSGREEVDAAYDSLSVEVVPVVALEQEGRPPDLVFRQGVLFDPPDFAVDSTADPEAARRVESDIAPDRVAEVIAEGGGVPRRTQNATCIEPREDTARRSVLERGAEDDRAGPRCGCRSGRW